MSPFQQGRESYLNCLYHWQIQNPYPEGSWEFDEFERGVYDAQDEYMEVLHEDD